MKNPKEIQLWAGLVMVAAVVIGILYLQAYIKNTRMPETISGRVITIQNFHESLGSAVFALLVVEDESGEEYFLGLNMNYYKVSAGDQVKVSFWPDCAREQEITIESMREDTLHFEPSGKRCFRRMESIKKI